MSDSDEFLRGVSRSVLHTVTSSAIISECGTYRYLLTREWDKQRPTLWLGMLNPSKADAQTNDPTITRAIERAKRLGFGRLNVWNLGAGRNTSPRDWAKMPDPIGPFNPNYIGRALRAACAAENDRVLVGWGAWGAKEPAKTVAGNVCKMAHSLGVPLYCLGITGGNMPTHPLYVPYDVALTRYYGPWL